MLLPPSANFGIKCRKPNLAVAPVIEREGRFLVVEQSVDGSQSVVNQPARHLEHGEARREARSWRRPGIWAGVVGLYLYPKPETSITYLRVCFHGSCFDHEPTRSLDHGILRAAWLSRAELASMPEKLRSPMVMCCIEDYLAGKRFSLNPIISHPWDGETP